MSLSAAVIDAMVNSGCTPEQMACVIKADLAERAARDARAIPWLVLRDMAFARDGYRCTYCGDEVGPFEIDHIIPRIKGGENILENVTVACRSCNRSKKDREGPGA